ncbi:16S rRNA (cytosine(1402)-N(4))-methyltransferase RsmH [Tropheryma whipplei]|uniref:16S rRNA (cytosine(1402)-N(4))-methyltransferase RsmH n=1 Tax=Tropheryma whipplei TaxID=2039 RepID=UPI0004B0D975|nr:16S rRNA (cytosine(1402)-N(4))-methyltransferase RsmH [Tropheryma whipplei]
MNGHLPVMLGEICQLIEPVLGIGDVFIDATLGAGGHSEAILMSSQGALLYGIDRDAYALALARKRLSGFADRCKFVHDTFDKFDKYLSNLHPKVFLFDLGMSSMQIDNPDRGFSYMKSGPLDMRMNESDKITAKEILNGYSETALIRIFRDYGQERYAKRIARQICKARSVSELVTTCQVSQLIRDVCPPHIRKGHPAKRVFQALRIEVNSELLFLRTALEKALDLLQVGGRIVVLSYHSLEDRIVKHLFRSVSVSQLPKGFYINKDPEYKLIGKDLKNPKETEIANNPRASSAHLRAVERVHSHSQAEAQIVEPRA